MKRSSVIKLLVGWGVAVQLIFSQQVMANLDLDKHSKEHDPLIGQWQGAIALGETKLRIHFNLSSDNGELVATMDSVDQGASGIPVSKITVAGNTIEMEVASAGAVYSGQFDHQVSAIKGTWRQGAHSFPLNLSKASGIVRKPQDPIKPYPYHEEEVSFINAHARVELSGTFTRPHSKEQTFPAVILISGSGPQNRDHSIMGHRPFLVLADHLTKNGIAVLRFDERGVGKSSGDFRTATSLDFADDVKAAVSYLQSRADINGKIGLIGHSEGGLIAPIAAADTPQLSFLVLLAAPGIPGDELSTRQFKRVMTYAGVSEETAVRGEEIYTALNRKSAGDRGKTVLVDEYESLYQSMWDETEDKIKQELTKFGGGSLSNERKSQLMSPWFRYLMTHQPAQWLAKIELPVLAINGGKDFQVDAQTNLTAIENALTSAGNRKITTQLLPQLNHLFQTANTGSMAEYAQIEETFAPEAMNLITYWIKSI